MFLFGWLYEFLLERKTKRSKLKNLIIWKICFIKFCRICLVSDLSKPEENERQRKNNNAEFKQEDLEILKSIFKVFANNVLGLTTKQESSSNDFTDEIMEIILKLRNHVKTNKDFVTADLIRDELDKVGIQIKDTREGSSWESKG